jgi:hypothetical protein
MSAPRLATGARLAAPHAPRLGAPRLPAPLDQRPPRPAPRAGAPRRIRPRPPRASGSSSAAPAPAPPAPDAPPGEEALPGEEPALKTYHYVAFAALAAAGLLLLAAQLFLATPLGYGEAVARVARRFAKTFALRQVGAILAAMAFVKYGLEPLIRGVRALTRASGAWEKSPEYYLLREVYAPLELLFLVAAFAALGENFVPQVRCARGGAAARGGGGALA